MRGRNTYEFPPLSKMSHLQLHYPVRLHDGVGLKVGRLLHEASHEQHGFALGVQVATVRQLLVVGEALGHALLKDDQGLVNVPLLAATAEFVSAFAAMLL